MQNRINWIVISGGPGLSNIYLQYALKELIPKNRIHFYHLAGSPESPEKDPSIERMVKQISETAQKNNLQEYGLITHSFGNYLAMQALEINPDPIKALIMLNPIPFKFQAWQTALNDLAKKIPTAILEEITKLSKHPNQGAELFRSLYPYYIGQKNKTLPIEVPFDINTCNTISAKISEYNHENLITTTKIPVVRIMGEMDPFFHDLEILKRETVIMEGTGHYPFFEDYEGFLRVLGGVGELLGDDICSW